MGTINEVLKKVWKYVLGAAIGGGLGFVVSDYILGEQQEEEANEWIQEDEETTDMPANAVPIEETLYGLKRISKEEMDTIVPSTEKELEKEGKETINVDYSSYSHSVTRPKNPPLEETAKRLLGTNAVPMKDNKSTVIPHVINVEEFSNGMPSHAKITLTYYAEDKVLCDSDETVVPNPVNILGKDILPDMFGQESEDPDVVYVRNEKIGTDYEIVRVHKSYSVEVLGVVPAESKAKKKTQKTRKVSKMDDQDEEE